MSTLPQYNPQEQGDTNKILRMTSVRDQVMDEEDEIDLLELLMVLLSKIHIIMIGFLAGAILFGSYAYFGIAPTYTSTAKLYVVSASSDSVVNLSDLNLGSSLTNDYQQLILSYPVMDRVAKQMDLDMTTEQLVKLVTLSNPKDTRILEIRCTTTDAQFSMDLANTIAEVSVDYLPETMSTNPPNIAQKAKIADHKTGPSTKKYAMMGALVFAMLICAWYVILFLLDDTVNTPEDMEKYFGVAPLTTIPYNEVLDHENVEHKTTSKVKRWRLKR